MPPIKRTLNNSAGISVKEWLPFKRQENRTETNERAESTEVNVDNIVIPETIDDVCSEAVSDSQSGHC